MALHSFSPEDLARLLEGNASCFTLRPLQPLQQLDAPSHMPLIVSAGELGPLPTGLPFISLADMPKMTSLPGLSGTVGAGALSLNLLDLPLFASLKDQMTQAANAAAAGAVSRQQQLLALPQLAQLPQLPMGKSDTTNVPHSQQPQQEEEEDSDEDDEDEDDEDEEPEPSNQRKRGKRDGPAERGRGRPKRSAHQQGSKSSSGKGLGAPVGRGGRSSRAAAVSSSPSPPPSKKQQQQGLQGGPPKRDRADRKRTLNREAQRRFRDRQKATMGELEELNAKQRNEIQALTLSNQILQQNYNALLEQFKNLQSKVLQLQLRTGVVIV